MPLTFTLGTTVLRQRRSKVLFQYPKQFRRVLERGDAKKASISISTRAFRHAPSAASSTSPTTSR